MPASDSNPGASRPRIPRAARRVLVVAAAAVALTPLGLVGAASFYFRHVPFEIPAAHAPPPIGPEAEAGRGLRLRYLGVTGYEITDGETTILVDPTPTRPTVRGLLRGPLEPDPRHHADLPRADYVLVNHAHFDHALDVPALALATGATVVGSASSVNLARSRGVPAEKTRLVRSGERLTLGPFVVDVREVGHTKILGISDPMSGTIPEDAGRLWFWQFTHDAALAYRIEGNGTSIWFHPSSVYTPGSADGLEARTLILGVTGEPLTPDKAKAAVAEIRPDRILPTHYDNFLQPMERGLGLMPGLDLEAARQAVAAADPDAAWYLLDYGQAMWLPPDAGVPGDEVPPDAEVPAP
jgi:L-ascorbate metabolism protein UlaG (beta-lactamase superfamily)